MSKFTTFLAGRYLTHSAYEHAISPMVIISFVSILVASFCLVLVSAIMNGFEYGTHEKLQAIHPQLLIKTTRGELDVDGITALLKKQQCNAIEVISPVGTQHAIIMNKHEHNEYSVAVLKGINPALEPSIIPLETNIQGSVKNIETLLKNKNIIIGNGLARQLTIGVGDPCELVIMNTVEDESDVNITKMQATVSGIFKMGIEEFDTAIAYCSLDFFKQLFPDQGIQEIHVKLNNNVDEALVIKELKEELQLGVYSWKDLYPALVSALKLQKYAMFLILTLICMVASMNIFAMLFMLISQKRSDIAMLRSLGYSSGAIIRLFMTIGFCLVTISSAVGILLGACAALVINHFKLISLPDAYYVSYLPAIIQLPMLLFIFLLILAISFVALWYPAYNTKYISISTVLRFEG